MEYVEATVTTNRELSTGNWLLKLAVPQPLPDIQPGQFLNLRCDPSDALSLLRPFSVLDTAAAQGTLSVYYKHLGRLSTRLSTIQAGTFLDCLYPLGRGFAWQQDWRRIALVGGGAGLAPLLFLARWLGRKDPEVEIHGFFGGATDGDLVPALLADYSFPMQLATMDGSTGHHGTVVDLFSERGTSSEPYDVIYTCGPNSMMAALCNVLPRGVPAFASLEEYLACGVGACYGCTAPIREPDGVHYRRVCCEGPVFPLREVEFA
jgi:dihydroorotate dehydrogenase electron transfer subunit